MADKDITKVRPNAIQVPQPSFMEEDKGKGVEELRHFVTPSRLKIVQKQSDDKLLQEFGNGYVILQKGDGSTEVIAKMVYDDKGNPIKGEPFMFTPVFFFAEYVEWNPRGTEPAIRGRTLNKFDDIALRSKNPETRSRPHPTAKGEIACSEQLNFLVVIDGQTEPAIMTFARGSHKRGRALCNLIQMRKSPLYGCRIEGMVAPDSNEKGSWWSFDGQNPPEGESPWVTDEAKYAAFKATNEEFQDLHVNSRLRPVYEEEVSRPDDNAPTSEF